MSNHFDDQELEHMENQENQTSTTEKRTKGGAQIGAGRKKGSSNKISATQILSAIKDTIGCSFETQLAMNYQTAISQNDLNVIAKYDQMFVSKLVTEVQTIDVTSGGNQLQGSSLVFVTAPNPGFPDDRD